MNWSAPTLADVFRAKQAIAPYLRPTPTIERPALDMALGCRAYLKCENLNPTGAFKVRGGINLVARLDPNERAAGVFSASTGNHGQSVAYAASLFGVAATIFVPRGANPVKVSSMRSLGATVIEHGVDFDEARTADIVEQKLGFTENFGFAASTADRASLPVGPDEHLRPDFARGRAANVDHRGQSKGSTMFEGPHRF